MPSVLLVYGTGEGQTAKVAGRIAAGLERDGFDATVVDVAQVTGLPAIADYDAVLVGASIHVGHHQDAVLDFVRDHREDLRTRPTGFFQVCLSAALDDEDAQAEAAGYVDDFVDATDWHPDRIGVFGGALRYSEYGFLTRLVVKRIAKGTTGDTDTSRDYEYTDWDEVDAFAADFAAFVDDWLAGDDHAADEPEVRP